MNTTFSIKMTSLQEREAVNKQRLFLSMYLHATFKSKGYSSKFTSLAHLMIEFDSAETAYDF